jgi:hypothetical protein
MLDGGALTLANKEEAAHLRRYIAITVDPVEVYSSSKAKDEDFPKRARQVISNYFRVALERAVGDAFPIVDSSGLLVLRLRAAIAGIDSGGETAPIDDPALSDKPLPKGHRC